MISGSSVQSGQGRMLVLCVGRLSRQGAILKNSQPIYKENYYLSKIEKLAENIYENLVYTSILFALIYCAKIIIKASQSSIDLLFEK